jgi:hypothetical protein
MKNITFNQMILLIIVLTLAYVVGVEMTGALIAGLRGTLRPEASNAVIDYGGIIIGYFGGILTKALVDEVRTPKQ